MGDEPPTAHDMIAAASRLQALVEPLRSDMDRERKLPQQIVDLMREERLFSLWLPTEYGGPDISMPASVRVIETLAMVDGAIEWCACTAAINNRLARFLPAASAQQIFVDGRASVAGALMPTGYAAIQPKGYSVSGRWGYASGIDHCGWALGACAVTENEKPLTNEDGSLQSLVAFFPTHGCEVIDTWDVGGCVVSAATTIP